jgi:hypothetical protein
MSALLTPKAHRLYVGQYAAKLGHGTSKIAYLPEYLPKYINDIGFDLAKLHKFGGSENLFDYAIVSLRIPVSDIEKFIISVMSELELQFMFARDGRAALVFGLELEIDRKKNRAYGQDDILYLLKHAKVQKLTRCVIVMQRCDYSKQSGTTNRIGSVANLVHEFDDLLNYITDKKLILLDFKIDNLCVCNGRLVVLDLDTKFIKRIVDNEKTHAKQFMALLFCFAGNRQLYENKERSDDIKRQILINYGLVNLPYDSSFATDSVANLYRNSDVIGRHNIRHYLTKGMNPSSSNVPAYIEESYIRPLFQAYALPPSPSSSSSMSILPPPPPQSNGSTNMGTFSNELGGGSQTKRRRNRRQKQKLSKTRKKRSLINNNLSR